MGCNCGGGSNTNQIQKTVKTQEQLVTPPIDCFYDKEILSNYKKLLDTVKEKELFSEINLNIRAVNSYLGLVQSALNYPDNYCILEPQLDIFRFSVLPNLIEHASKYID